MVKYSCLAGKLNQWGPSIREDGCALRKALQSNVSKLYVTLNVVLYTQQHE